MDKNYFLAGIALFCIIFISSCNKNEETPIEKTVIEKLSGTWLGDSMHVEVALNGMAIDSLTQTIKTDTLSLILNTDSSYEFVVGKIAYKGNFSLKHNDSEIVIEDLGEMLNSYLPDSIQADIQQQIFIEELNDKTLILNGQTFANIVYQDVPVQLQLKTMSYFHKKN